MPDYLAFVYGAISEPSGDAFEDGKELAEKCLRDLEIKNKEKFPAKLLILLASPAYLDKQDASKLLNGINRTFNTIDQKVPLIGSSVAAVFFEEEVHHQGALLICLASNLLEVKIACGKNARENPQKAINGLLNDLGFNSSDTDPNPLANRLFITFFPGVNSNAEKENFYPAPEIHNLLYQGVKSRIMLTGGISSANDRARQRDGLQFFENEVENDSVVTASIITGIPIGIGLNDALVRTGEIVSVNDVDEDGRTITKFNDSKKISPEKRLNQIGTVGKDLMLAKMTSDDERVLDLPLKVGSKGWINLLRPVEPGDYFEALLPEKDILQVFNAGIKQSEGRASIKNPVANLLFLCKSYLRFHEQKIMNIEEALTKLESSKTNPYIGGFFDGEIGVDEVGRSRIANGTAVYLTFGDEMRERTPLYEGISALAEFGPEFLAGIELTPNSIDNAIDSALKIIVKAGFPGATLSLKVSSLDRESESNFDWVVEKQSVGSRYSKNVKLIKYRLKENDPLEVIEHGKTPLFIPDSNMLPNRSKDKPGTISQYILPLKRLDDSILGFLQVDVGNLQHLTHMDFCNTEKARVLNCLAEVIGAGLHRLGAARENKIMIDIDKALNKAMSANRFREGIQTFIEELKETFDVEMGHIWLTDIDERTDKLDHNALFLKAGFGKFYETAKRNGEKIQAESESPVFLAYSKKDPHIINDLKEDVYWQKILEIPEKQKKYQKLRNIQSYAAIGFESNDKKVFGVISLGSSKPWFFLSFHQKTMKVLADRLLFLVEHLKKKIYYNFLLAVSPKLMERDLKDTQNILSDVTEIFCKALEATHSSLYLWDRHKNKYVLRAESGWVKKEWIHAASYSNDVDWIGLRSEDSTPVYEADVYEYYKKQKYKFPKGRYTKHIFGRSLSKDFTVEAIGLPLQIGKEKTKFGILTLYRQIKKGQSSGFVTKNIELLKEGAYQAAGLIKAVLEERDSNWRSDEADQRHKLHKEINSIEVENGSFEGNICRAVINHYKASEVALYRIDNSKEVISNEWIIGYRSNNGNIEKINKPSKKYSEIIEKQLDINGKEPKFNRRELKRGDDSTPEELKLEGVIDEAFLPLISDKEYFAALIIRWNSNSHEFLFPKIQIDEHFLKVRNRIIASSYSRYRQKNQIEMGQIGIQTAGVYVFQYAHKFVNALQRLYRISQLITTAHSDNDKTAETNAVERLRREASLYMGEMDWIFDLGELIQNPNCESLNLHGLIKKCWKAVESLDIHNTVFTNIVDKKIFVKADHRLIKEVFTNLMKNAQNSAKPREHNSQPHRLQIEANVTQDKEEVRIIFSDNGKGMSKSQIDFAERGFVHTNRKYDSIEHKGVGVLISKYLLRVQDGNLKYNSEEGNGTNAIVVLPNVINKRGKK